MMSLIQLYGYLKASHMQDMAQYSFFSAKVNHEAMKAQVNTDHKDPFMHLFIKLTNYHYNL